MMAPWFPDSVSEPETDTRPPWSAPSIALDVDLATMEEMVSSLLCGYERDDPVSQAALWLLLRVRYRLDAPDASIVTQYPRDVISKFSLAAHGYGILKDGWPDIARWEHDDPMGAAVQLGLDAMLVAGSLVAIYQKDTPLSEWVYGLPEWYPHRRRRERRKAYAE